MRSIRRIVTDTGASPHRRDPEAPPPCADQPEVVDLDWATAGQGRLTTFGRLHAREVIRDYCQSCHIPAECLEVVNPASGKLSVIAGGMAWSQGVRVKAVQP